MISPPQSEARPAFEIDPLGEMKSLRPPGRKHARNVGKKQAGDDRLAVRAHDRRERRREQPQRLGENVGEYEIVSLALAHGPRLDPARDDRPAQSADAVQLSIGVGDRDRHRIDVAKPDLAAQDLGGGDREHARAAADVEDSASAAGA